MGGVLSERRSQRTRLGAGDLNQDGKLDLGIAVQFNYCDTEYSGENTWGAAAVYTGNGEGTFTLDVGPWMGGVDNSGIALGDFNRDGMIDMAVAGNAEWTSQAGSQSCRTPRNRSACRRSR
jgi:hypothetical protein